jgi:hypothetical protein
MRQPDKHVKNGKQMLKPIMKEKLMPTPDETIEMAILIIGEKEKADITRA